MIRNRFLFFENFKATADKLPDELRLKFYDALTDYAFNEVEPDDDIISALINALKPSLNCEVSSWGGYREGAGRKSKLIKINQDELENLEMNQDEIKINQDEKEKKKNSPLNPQEEKNKNIYTPAILTDSCPQEGHTHLKKSVKPTIEEVASYCRERNNEVDAERWFDFYTSKGWRVGSQPMKDWKAAVRTWERRNDNQAKARETQEDWYL